MRLTNQGQNNSAKVHLQTPAKRRQRTPEEDDEGESGSSRNNSLGKSTEKAQSRPDGRRFEMSDHFEVIEHDVCGSTSGSGDEDGYVHVPGSGGRP